MASPFGFQFPDLKGLPASALHLEVGVKYHKMTRIVKWRFDITSLIARLVSPYSGLWRCGIYLDIGAMGGG